VGIYARAKEVLAFADIGGLDSAWRAVDTCSGFCDCTVYLHSLLDERSYRRTQGVYVVVAGQHVLAGLTVTYWEEAAASCLPFGLFPPYTNLILHRSAESVIATSELARKLAILVTGGAGFIGSNFVLARRECDDELIINLDKLTYAGNLDNLASIPTDERYVFVKGDICDFDLMLTLLRQYKVRAVVNFAAESHVDRSIHGPEDFIQTNVLGTFRLLDAVRAYWDRLTQNEKAAFRFVHASTDEVYGSLTEYEAPFTEASRYAPNSPYSATKAASDHLVRAYHHTYGLPTVTTNCSNNYGPYQFPEKLVPLVILNALSDKPLPVYGDGKNIRDWLYVGDHCRAICLVLAHGRVGEIYSIGGGNEKTNLDVVHTLCANLDELKPKPDGRSYREQIAFVKDRPGHDRRYAIDARKMQRELGWRPHERFETGIRRTLGWYLDNLSWVEKITGEPYRQWIECNYMQRSRELE
jgi:dTDP-glucose 4,6-dehydratase